MSVNPKTYICGKNSLRDQETSNTPDKNRYQMKGCSFFTLPKMGQAYWTREGTGIPPPLRDKWKPRGQILSWFSESHTKSQRLENRNDIQWTTPKKCVCVHACVWHSAQNFQRNRGEIASPHARSGKWVASTPTGFVEAYSPLCWGRRGKCTDNTTSVTHSCLMKAAGKPGESKFQV